jgi:hypothetical protein
VISYLKKTKIKKPSQRRTGGVAQGVGAGPQFKYQFKKRTFKSDNLCDQTFYCKML